MPSKEDICVVQDNFLPPDVEELVAAITHNLHLKSRPSHSVHNNKQRRMSPYAAPVRSVCRNKLNNSTGISSVEHSSPNCKYCLLRSKSSKNSSQDPYEILTLLSKGILINEAVKRLQKDIQTKRSKKTDFYDLEDVENEIVESV